jgi:TolB-like protein/Flp pilus assembly protein TadD
VRTLAVLPFRPLVEGSSDPALEIGMADALITRLSAVPGLIVRPLSSVRAYANADQDPLHAGRELNVEAILEGHVLVRSNRVRVTARLLEIANGAALWSGSFEEPLDQFFAAQDALAGQVVSALQIEMTDRDRLQLLEHPTDNVQAWQLYLNGRHHWERKTPESMYRAIEYYEAAEKLDPAFALAAVGQADSWAVLGVYHVLPTAEAFRRAGAAAERALAIAPELPEALAAMGHVLVQGQRDWQGGERLYRRALKVKPRFAQCHMWLANDCAFQGRLSEAIAGARHAQELEPLSLTFAANVGLILYFMRDYATAQAQLGPLVEAAPEFVLARNHLARVLLAIGTPEKAIEVLGGKSSAAPGGLATLGRAYAATGQRDLAAAEIRQLEQRGARGIGVGCDLALIHAALGDLDRALDAVERGLRDGSQQIASLNLEPGFDPIRNHPRFRAVVREARLG